MTDHDSWCQWCSKRYRVIWHRESEGCWSAKVMCDECHEIMKSGPKQPLPQATARYRRSAA